MPDVKRRKQILFQGAGGGYHYYLGIGHVLQRYVKPEHNIIWCGISAGCFAILPLAAELDIDDMYNKVNIRVLGEVSQRKFGALFTYNRHAKNALLDYLPEDAWERVNGKMRVSTTLVPSMKNEIIDTYTSNEDLIGSIFSSGFVPLFGKGLWMTHRGLRRLDGGISDLLGEKFHGDDVDTFVISKDRWRPMKASWFWCWSSIEWADTLYKWGVEDTYKHLDEILQFLEGEYINELMTDDIKEVNGEVELQGTISKRDESNEKEKDPLD